MKTIPSIIAAAALLAPAVGAAPEATPEPIRVIEVADSSAGNWRQSKYHGPLNAILVFVHDRATADAAAPRVAALFAAAEGREVVEPHGTLAHVVERMDCYGSEALREALRPVLDESDLVDSPEVKQFRERCLPIIDEMNARTVALTQQLEAVTDADSAAKAAAALTASYATMGELAARLEAEGRGIRFGMGDMYRVSAIATERRMGVNDRFLHAYAHAQTRPGGPYAELTKAIEGEAASYGDLPQKLKQQLMAALEPAFLLRCEQSAEALREWLARASTIRDKAGADASADWLEQKSTELGFPVGTCWHDYAQNKLEHHCMSNLACVLENTAAYFHYARPAYFGSEKLQKLFPPVPGSYLMDDDEEGYDEEYDAEEE